MVVNYEDEGQTYYAEQDGTRVQDISEWKNKFGYETIKARSNAVKQEKTKVFVYELVVPIILVLITIICVLIYWWGRKHQ